jgi:hypothetical protein
LGWYVVRDVLNKRYKNAIDILSYTRVGMTESAIVEIEIN